MKTIGERIKQRRKSLKLTQAQVAKGVGVSHVALSQWERDETSPSGENLHALAKVLGCSTPWILFGIEESTNVEPSVVGGFKIPVISYVQAGMWHLEGEGNLRGVNGDYEYIFTDLPLSPSSFALKVNGKSMEPEFKEGDRIIIDPEVCPTPGDFVVAMNDNDEVTFKKYRLRGVQNGEEVFELIPLNPDFPTLDSRQNKITILGTLIEHRRYRKSNH